MMFNTLAVDADTEWLMIDATTIRAHQYAAGAKGEQQTQVLGRCRGGCTTKLHACAMALGHPLRFIVTGGERHDCTQAQALKNSTLLPVVRPARGQLLMTQVNVDRA